MIVGSVDVLSAGNFAQTGKQVCWDFNDERVAASIMETLGGRI